MRIQKSSGHITNPLFGIYDDKQTINSTIPQLGVILKPIVGIIRYKNVNNSTACITMQYTAQVISCINICCSWKKTFI